MTSPAPGEVPNPQATGSSGPRTMTDLLALADAERTLVNWLLRQRGASLADIVAHTHIESADLQATLDKLIAAGFLIFSDDADPALFKPNLVSRKPRTMPEKLWKALE